MPVATDLTSTAVPANGAAAPKTIYSALLPQFPEVEEIKRA